MNPNGLVLTSLVQQQSAALNSLASTGCQLTDVKCICNSAPYLSTLQGQVAQACSPADQGSMSLRHDRGHKAAKSRWRLCILTRV